MKQVFYFILLDLSVATRIHAKKGLVETYFVVAVICVYVLTDIVLSDPPIKLDYA